MSLVETLAIAMAMTFTLVIYSFLWKENRAYRLAEHIFIGSGVGFGIMFAIEYVYTNAIKPMGETIAAGLTLYNTGYLFGKYILPMFLGVLLYFFFSRRYLWIYRIPMAIFVGIGLGLAMSGAAQTQLVKQILDTMLDLIYPLMEGNWIEFINALIIFIGVTGTLAYFFFTTERGSVRTWGVIGRWTMMVAFGAAFGYTVMARISLLIGRVHDMIVNWKITSTLFIIGVVLAILSYLFLKEEGKT